MNKILMNIHELIYIATLMKWSFTVGCCGCGHLSFSWWMGGW